MKDFWLSCGHHLLDRDAGGGLVVTDDFLKVYLARPELAPPPEACVVEKTLHAALMADPRRAVAPDEIAAIADADARENWQVMIAFRDRLTRHPTLEAAYLDIVRTGAKVPHIFLNQLVHVILRNALDGCEDPFVLRAAELFFRTQRMTLHEGSLIAADEETIAGTSQTPTSPLVSMLGIPAEAEIDVMSDDNAEHYFEHSDQFHVALDLTAGRRGLVALGEAMRRWIAHLLGVEVAIEPLTELREAKFTWYVGLDTDGSRIGDALWNGDELDEATAGRVVGLFRLTFRDPAIVIEKVRGEPVYLILAMSDDKLLALQAAEPRHRPADPPSGGRHMSPRVPALAHSGRRRGGAAQGRVAMDRLHLGARRGAARRAGHRAVDHADAATTNARRFYAGSADIELYRRGDHLLSRQSRDRRAVALGRAGPTEADPPYELFTVTADPAEGEGLTEAGSNIVEPVPMPEPIREIVAAFVAEHHVERQFFKRKRDRARSGIAGAARLWRSRRMSGEDDFLQRWSRRKREAAEAAKPARAATEPRPSMSRRRRKAMWSWNIGTPARRPNSIPRPCRRSNRSTRCPTSRRSCEPAFRRN